MWSAASASAHTKYTVALLKPGTAGDARRNVEIHTSTNVGEASARPPSASDAGASPPRRGRGSRRVQPRVRPRAARAAPAGGTAIGQRRRWDLVSEGVAPGPYPLEIAVDPSAQRLALARPGVGRGAGGRPSSSASWGGRGSARRWTIMRGQLDRGSDGRANLRVGGSRIVRDPSHERPSRSMAVASAPAGAWRTLRSDDRAASTQVAGTRHRDRDAECRVAQLRSPAPVRGDGTGRR